MVRFTRFQSPTAPAVALLSFLLLLLFSSVPFAEETKNNAALLVAADVLMNGAVVDADGNEVARLENLLIDASDGTIELVTLSLPGSNRVVGVPWSFLSVEDDVLRLAVTTEELESAPELERESQGPSTTSARRARQAPQAPQAPMLPQAPAQPDDSPQVAYAPDNTVEFVPGERRVYEAVVVGKVVADLKRGSDREVVLIVDLGDGDAHAHVGPAWYLDKAGVTLEPGSAVTLTGSRDATEADGVIVVSELSQGDKTVVIRNPDGSPVWPAYR